MTDTTAAIEAPKPGEVWQYYTGTPTRPKVHIVGIGFDKSRSSKPAVVFFPAKPEIQDGGPRLEIMYLETFMQIMSGGRQRYSKVAGAAVPYAYYKVKDWKSWIADLPDEAMFIGSTGVRKLRENEYGVCGHPECPNYGPENECPVCEFHLIARP
jgi:hypothetical protein